MAVVKGCSGVVRIGAIAIAEVKSWSFSGTKEKLDKSIINDGCNKSSITSGETIAISLSCFWDPADTTGQVAMFTAYNNGTEVNIELYPGPAMTGNKYYEMDALVLSFAMAGDASNIVSCDFTLESNSGYVLSTMA